MKPKGTETKKYLKKYYAIQTKEEHTVIYLAGVIYLHRGFTLSFTKTK